MVLRRQQVTGEELGGKARKSASLLLERPKPKRQSVQGRAVSTKTANRPAPFEEALVQPFVLVQEATEWVLNSVKSCCPRD